MAGMLHPCVQGSFDDRDLGHSSARNVLLDALLLGCLLKAGQDMLPTFALLGMASSLSVFRRQDLSVKPSLESKDFGLDMCLHHLIGVEVCAEDLDQRRLYFAYKDCCSKRWHPPSLWEDSREVICWMKVISALKVRSSSSILATR